MGNAPSTAELPPEWEDILPNITREDILHSAKKRIVERKEEEFSFGKSILLLDQEIFDLDEHVNTALAILRAAPHLKDIRFRLVPNKMKEEKFWAALFGVLNYAGIDIDEIAGKINDDYETGDDDFDDRYGREQSPPQSPPEQTTQNYDDSNGYYESSVDATNTPRIFLDEFQKQKELIHRLQKSLREANHKTRKLALELQKERNRSTDKAAINGGREGSSSGGEVHVDSLMNGLSAQQQKPHRGNWEIHPDCRDFLSLDEHLKANLREGKQKRVDEVLSQMKFILDSDDIKDTYGKWSCCGEEKYSCSCK